MNEITVSAKTLDDAITEASIQLGVSSDQMEYDVIEKGSAGFWGIGCKQAVIKAKIKSAETVQPVKKEEPKKEVKPAIKPEIKPEIKSETKAEEVKIKKAPETPVVKVEKKPLEVTAVTEETKKICETFLHDVLQAMNMGEVKIASKVDEDGALSIEMEGENMGILIGKRGQTLDSLQYLTNRVANKSQDGYVRVKLDTEDYRRRRKETLEGLAGKMASKVKKSRRPVSLEPMNPYERRIIHSALQSDDRISTHSEGEEPYRRVVITLSRR